MKKYKLFLIPIFFLWSILAYSFGFKFKVGPIKIGHHAENAKVDINLNKPFDQAKKVAEGLADAAVHASEAAVKLATGKGHEAGERLSKAGKDLTQSLKSVAELATSTWDAAYNTVKAPILLTHEAVALIFHEITDDLYVKKTENYGYENINKHSKIIYAAGNENIYVYMLRAQTRNFLHIKGQGTKHTTLTNRRRCFHTLMQEVSVTPLCLVGVYPKQDSQLIREIKDEEWVYSCKEEYSSPAVYNRGDERSEGGDDSGDKDNCQEIRNYLIEKYNSNLSQMEESNKDKILIYFYENLKKELENIDENAMVENISEEDSDDNSNNINNNAEV